MLPKEAWLSRFNGHFSLLSSANWNSNAIRISEFSPRGESDDDFLVRFETSPFMPSSSPATFSLNFFPEAIGGGEEAEVVAIRPLGYGCLLGGRGG